MLDRGRDLLDALLRAESWLPAFCTRPHPQFYQQYLLHCDPVERFSVVSFVWGPGQETPVHDHQTWGLIGMLRGAEISTSYERAGGELVKVGTRRLEPGEIETVSPRLGDIHQVRNAFDDRVSISIHVYGDNIGSVMRHVFRPDGSAADFTSGYSAGRVPNLWNRQGNGLGWADDDVAEDTVR